VFPNDNRSARTIPVFIFSLQAILNSSADKRMGLFVMEINEFLTLRANRYRRICFVAKCSQYPLYGLCRPPLPIFN